MKNVNISVALQIENISATPERSVGDWLSPIQPVVSHSTDKAVPARTVPYCSLVLNSPVSSFHYFSDYKFVYFPKHKDCRSLITRCGITIEIRKEKQFALVLSPVFSYSYFKRSVPVFSISQNFKIEPQGTTVTTCYHQRTQRIAVTRDISIRTDEHYRGRTEGQTVIITSSLPLH